MSLLTTLTSQSNALDDKRAIVKDEIISYFAEIYKDEAKVRSCFGEDNIRERKRVFMIEFWEYLSGCSATHFSVGPFRWDNPENPEGYESYNYKGVALRDIQREVVNRLTVQAAQYFDSQGFDVSYENKPSRLELARIELTVRW